MASSLVALIIIIGFCIFAIIYWGFIRELSFKGIMKRIFSIIVDNVKIMSITLIAFLCTGTLGFGLVWILIAGSDDAWFSIIFGIIFVFVVLIESGVFVKLENKIIVKLACIGSKVEREIPDEYSPALVSYIQNLSIEPNKDIVATILNLVAKGVINIEEKDNKVTITKTKKTDAKLSADERYIYFIINENYDIDEVGKEWADIIKKEAKYKLLITNKTNHIYFFLFILVAIFAYIYFCKTTIGDFSNDLALRCLISVCILLMPVAIFEELKKKKIGYDLYKGYTNSGLRLQRKLSGFKKFIKNYSIIDQRNIEEVYLWEKYLAYAISLNINVKYKNKIIEQLKRYQDINTDSSIYDKLFDE